MIAQLPETPKGHLQESMRNQEMLKANKGTLSDFGMLYKESNLSGACDIDFIYEKKGRFIIGEGKQLFKGEMSVPLGQYIMLRAFRNVAQCERVFFVAHEKTTPYRYYMCGLDHFDRNCVELPRIVNGKEMKCKVIERPDMMGPYTASQMAKKVKHCCDQLNV